MSAAELSIIKVRPVTDGDVETFVRNGWVTVPGLVSADVAGELLRRVKMLMSAGTLSAAPEKHQWFDSLRMVSRADPVFRAITLNREMGRNITRLLGRESSIRLFHDTLMVKMPLSTDAEHGSATEFHHDSYRPIDRSSVSCWLALNEITPEMGSLQYYNGSHKLGPLGLAPPSSLVGWPRLQECTVSECSHFSPGDAVLHISDVVHGAPANSSQTPRWAFVTTYFPGDALYTNVPYEMTDSLGLIPLEPFDHPEFPVVYDPNA